MALVPDARDKQRRGGGGAKALPARAVEEGFAQLKELEHRCFLPIAEQ